MKSFHKSSFRATLFSIGVASSALVGSWLALQAPAQAIIPAYTIPSVCSPPGMSTGCSGPSTVNPSSYGFYFDTAANIQIDALGFYAYDQSVWNSGRTYTVQLWSYSNGGLVPGDYSPLASTTFTAGTPYTNQDGYFWRSLLSNVNLPDSFNSDPTDQIGYVITAYGDFSGVSGYVPTVATGGSIFHPNVLMAGNGYVATGDSGGFFPIPAEDGGVGLDGYFVPNLSLVPGPLPVLGAAAGFGWTRRLRKRIRASK